MSFLTLKVAVGLFTEVAALIHRPRSLEFGFYFGKQEYYVLVCRISVGISVTGDLLKLFEWNNNTQNNMDEMKMSKNQTLLTQC